MAVAAETRNSTKGHSPPDRDSTVVAESRNSRCASNVDALVFLACRWRSMWRLLSLLREELGRGIEKSGRGRS
ncbi:unnamed protein product [Linum trigynum]|uniref:Uncharacterized protein n=1 Tax=Linum trigynum TaxID=586398 RepID=A0AAV2FX51_9ROSI